MGDAKNQVWPTVRAEDLLALSEERTPRPTLRPLRLPPPLPVVPGLQAGQGVLCSEVDEATVELPSNCGVLGNPQSASVSSPVTAVVLKGEASKAVQRNSGSISPGLCTCNGL